jgi:hypothetical protein
MDDMHIIYPSEIILKREREANDTIFFELTVVIFSFILIALE